MSIVDTIKSAWILGRQGQPVADVQSLTAMILRDNSSGDNQRAKDIAARWDAYYGNSPKPLTVKRGDADDNIRLNYAGRVVDEGVSFLFGLNIDFVVEDGRDDAEDNAQGGESDDDAPAVNLADDWLEACWGANAGMTLLSELAINGGVAGTAFLMIAPADPERNDHPYPRLMLVDPATITATWDGSDYKRILQWVIRWTAIDPDTQKPAQYRKLISREVNRTWTIADEVSRNDGRTWDSAGPPITWPYSWCPVFHCQNLPAPNQFYGTSDLEQDVLEAGNAVNFTTSNIGRILRFHAHPKTWGRGVGAQEVPMGVDNLTLLRGENAMLQNLEMTSDLSSSLEFGKSLLRGFHAVARIPQIATGQLENLGQLSGLALKVLYGPLIRKNAIKQRLYGDLLRDASQRLLELGGFAGQKVSITWPDPLPSDPVAERQALVIDEQLGVSQRTVLEKLGYDADAEQTQKAKEQKDLGDTLLGQFDKGQMGSGAAGGGGQPE